MHSPSRGFAASSTSIARGPKFVLLGQEKIAAIGNGYPRHILPKPKLHPKGEGGDLGEGSRGRSQSGGWSPAEKEHHALVVAVGRQEAKR